MVLGVLQASEGYSDRRLIRGSLDLEEALLTSYDINVELLEFGNIRWQEVKRQ